MYSNNRMRMNARSCASEQSFPIPIRGICPLMKSQYLGAKKNYNQGPVVQKPINANPRLKVNQGVYFYTPRCCSTLILGKTLHKKKSILKNKNRQKKLSPKS